MCGEKALWQSMHSSSRGSPPRVRGKVSPVDSVRTCAGITPACAGKRRRQRVRRTRAEDHPRVCGEKCGKAVRYRPRQGSPPRVRGKVSLSDTRGAFFRITPACAGKRITLGGKAYQMEDHPRVCGEKSMSHPNMTHLQGSPPRVRGKACSAPLRVWAAGITPACAGKRALLLAGTGAQEDHPRVCGEKAMAPPRWATAMGSPPRVRGKVSIFFFYSYFCRITPACAGKSRR